MSGFWGRLGRGAVLSGLLVLALSPVPALAAARVALVIGNGSYQQVQPLTNPANDARTMAAALERLGFDVDLGIDLDRGDVWAALKRLVQRAQGAEATVFYYAGHGVRNTGTSYLVPVDAALESELDLAASAVRVGDLLAHLEAAPGTTLVFLDACRNDPFAGRPAASRALLPSSGMTGLNAGKGMLVAYATGDGDTAADGSARNSPFTAALLAHIETPGLEVKQMLTRVRTDLASSTAGQLSETSDRLLGDFFFKEKAPEPAPAVALPMPSGPRDDLVLWQGIQSSTSAGDYELFLSLHPTSPFAPFARARVTQLRAAAAPALLAAPAPARPTPALPTPAPAPAPAPAPEVQVAAVAPAVEALEAGEAERALTPAVGALDLALWVKEGGANLRSGPDQSNRRLGFLPAGTPVTATDQRGDWYEVALADGRRGFVAARLLEEVAPAAPVAEAAAVTPPPASARRGRAPGEVFRDCEACPELVAVAPGAFRMGSPETDPAAGRDEGPVRDIALTQPLAVGRFEVSFAEWDACIAGGGCGGYRPDDEGWGRGRRPVINVSYYDAAAYLTWLAQRTGKPYRLLSEAEWEFAARAGNAATTPWDHDPSLACRSANGHDLSSQRENRFSWEGFGCDDRAAVTAPGGTFGANAFGVSDLLGNVWELTADCYRPDLQGQAADGRADATELCPRRVIRGGSWRAYPEDLRFAAREEITPQSRTSDQGFRIARELKEGLRRADPALAAEGR